MAKSPSKRDPLQPGALIVRESVKALLFALRHFTIVSLQHLSPPRHLEAAELDISLVEQVEATLKCQLPHEIMACIANKDDELCEYGFRLDQIVDHTVVATERGCSKDLIAVGRDPDFLAFFCVARTGSRERATQIADLDNLDGSLNWYDLRDWLALHVERRQEFLADQYPELKGWTPSPVELADFKPSLV